MAEHKLGVEQREQWGTRAGFLMAAIGSAIGLGNIWRFPYIAYDNGGGAFLLPYLIALFTAGIPLLILEYTIGHRYRGAAPRAFLPLARPAQAIGWWQVAMCFVIATYYAVIIAWAVRYTGFSVGQQWGDDPEKFLMSDFLQTSESPGMVSSYVSGVAWPLIGVWVVTLAIVAFGIRRGVEKANKIFIPLLIALFLILVVRALFLPGAEVGLDALFSPDWSAITDGQVWIAAYGQIFFSLSVGFGIMITYASYLRRRSDLTGSALVAGFANSSFELLAGIGVFATVGFMAVQSGVGVNEVVTDGVGLAFVAFPQIISTLPGGATLFGLLFPTREGLYILDAADHFINQYGIALAGLVTVITVSWVLRKLGTLRDHANASSAVPLGRWWVVTLSVITPIILGWMTWDSLRTELASNYEDYPTSFLLVAGWGVVIAVIVFAVVMTLIPWRRNTPDDDHFHLNTVETVEGGRR